jgi:lysophospholipase L1-like esterase
MEIALLALITVSVGWWLLKGKDAAKPPTLVRAGDEVWLLGDSLAEGIWPTLSKLAQDHDVNLAGTTSRGVPISWARTATPPPQAVATWLVCLGANDAAIPSVSAGNIRRDVRAILDRTEAKVIWIMPPDGGGLPGLDVVTAAIRQEVPEENILEAPTGLTFAKDGVHLTPASYATWAEQLWRALHGQ